MNMILNKYQCDQKQILSQLKKLYQNQSKLSLENILQCLSNNIGNQKISRFLINIITKQQLQFQLKQIAIILIKKYVQQYLDIKTQEEQANQISYELFNAIELNHNNENIKNNLLNVIAIMAKSNKQLRMRLVKWIYQQNVCRQKYTILIMECIKYYEKNEKQAILNRLLMNCQNRLIYLLKNQNLNQIYQIYDVQKIQQQIKILVLILKNIHIISNFNDFLFFSNILFQKYLRNQDLHFKKATHIDFVYYLLRYVTKMQYQTHLINNEFTMYLQYVLHENLKLLNDRQMIPGSNKNEEISKCIEIYTESIMVAPQFFFLNFKVIFNEIILNMFEFKNTFYSHQEFQLFFSQYFCNLDQIQEQQFKDQQQIVTSQNLEKKVQYFLIQYMKFQDDTLSNIFGICINSLQTNSKSFISLIKFLKVLCIVSKKVFSKKLNNSLKSQINMEIQNQGISKFPLQQYFVERNDLKYQLILYLQQYVKKMQKQFNQKKNKDEVLFILSHFYLLHQYYSIIDQQLSSQLLFNLTQVVKINIKKDILLQTIFITSMQRLINIQGVNNDKFYTNLLKYLIKLLLQRKSPKCSILNLIYKIIQSKTELLLINKHDLQHLVVELMFFIKREFINVNDAVIISNCLNILILIIQIQDYNFLINYIDEEICSIMHIYLDNIKHIDFQEEFLHLISLLIPKIQPKIQYVSLIDQLPPILSKHTNNLSILTELISVILVYGNQLIQESHINIILKMCQRNANDDRVKEDQKVYSLVIIEIVLIQFGNNLKNSNWQLIQSILQSCNDRSMSIQSKIHYCSVVILFFNFNTLNEANREKIMSKTIIFMEQILKFESYCEKFGFKALIFGLNQLIRKNINQINTLILQLIKFLIRFLQQCYTFQSKSNQISLVPEQFLNYYLYIKKVCNPLKQINQYQLTKTTLITINLKYPEIKKDLLRSNPFLRILLNIQIVDGVPREVLHIKISNPV